MKVESNGRAFTKWAGALGSILSNTQTPTQIRSSTKHMSSVELRTGSSRLVFLTGTLWPYLYCLFLNSHRLSEEERKSLNLFFQNVILMPQLDLAKSCCTKRTMRFSRLVLIWRFPTGKCEIACRHVS